MKPQLIITDISESKCYWQSDNPSSLTFDLKISVQGDGNFTSYLNGEVLDRDRILMDILQGRIDIVGLNNIRR